MNDRVLRFTKDCVGTLTWELCCVTVGLEQFISEALDKAEFGMAWSPWVLKKKRRELVIQETSIKTTANLTSSRH